MKFIEMFIGNPNPAWMLIETRLKYMDDFAFKCISWGKCVLFLFKIVTGPG